METDLLPPMVRPPRVAFVRWPAGRDAANIVWTPNAPGSKYYTLRYLLNALLAEGESVVRNPAISEDTAVLIGAMRAFGANVAWEAGDTGGVAWQVRVRGVGGRLRAPGDGVVQAGNAGAVLRLLLGIAATLPEIRFVTDHPESLGKRPNGDLLDALGHLGVEWEATGADGRLPITLRGGNLHGGAVTISGATSSQYISALLYLAPLLPEGLEITVTDALRSAPLIRTTLRALGVAGIQVAAADDLRRLVVAGGQRYLAGVFDVPGDGPSAAALAAVASVIGSGLRLRHLPVADEDVGALVDVLQNMGVELTRMPDGESTEEIVIASGARLHGVTVDGDAFIDSVPALVAAACFADGESRFENVATLRLKESDRIGDLSHELRSAGCDVEPLADVIVVRGRSQGVAGGGTVAGHDDHRLVQALAIAALGSDGGLTITGAEAVAKSYPAFFADLVALGADVREVEA